MYLKGLIALREEVGQALDKYGEELELVLADSLEDLQMCLWEKEQDSITLQESILVIARDDTLNWLRGMGIGAGMAKVGYLSKEYPGQRFSGVDMLIEGFEEVDKNFLEKVLQRWHGFPWTIAYTKRCEIRELQLSDVQALIELYEDEQVRRFAEPPYPYEEEMDFQRAYIKNMYGFYGYGMWLIWDRETGKLIGRAGLEHREYNGETELELGYLIAPPFQGRGLATEVCGQILRIAAGMTDFKIINCLIDAGNTASVALAKRLGFTLSEEMELNECRMLRYVRLL